MAENTRKLGHHHPNHLSAFRDFDPKEFLYGEAIDKGIAGRSHIIATLCQRDYLMIVLVFTGLLVTPVQIPQMWDHVHYHLAVKFHYGSEHPVSAGMMGPQIQFQEFAAKIRFWAHLFTHELFSSSTRL
jgi:hypothetical protein